MVSQMPAGPRARVKKNEAGQLRTVHALLVKQKLGPADVWHMGVHPSVPSGLHSHEVRNLGFLMELSNFQHCQ